MRAIVDSDTMAFASAVMAENESVQQACWNVANAVEKLSARLNGIPMTFYLTGEDNFRYKIFPEYKANRRDQPRPKYLEAVKEYMVENYSAVISHGCEADDLCGIDQTQSSELGEQTLLCHIDKDLDMIVGKHYNPAIIRNLVEVRPEREYIISPNDAMYNFYYQLLVGDPTDGIKGAIGIGKVKAKSILDGCTTELEMYERVRDYFSCDEELLINAQCLWIWRKPDGLWQPPKE